MRQRLVFLLVCCVCDVISKTKYFTTEDDLSFTPTEKYVDATDSDTSDISFTVKSTASLNDDIEESTSPISVPKLSKITEATTEVVNVSDKISKDFIYSASNSIPTTEKLTSSTTLMISNATVTGVSTSTTDIPPIITTIPYPHRSFTLKNTASLNNDIEESTSPISVPKLSKYRIENPQITKATTEVVNVSDEISIPTTEKLTSSTTLMVTGVSTSTTDIPPISTTTANPQRICSAPKLSYTDLQIFWDNDSNEDKCVKTNITFDCTRISDGGGYVNATYNLADTKNYAVLDKDSLNLQIGYQYNCISEFRDEENVVVSDSTSMIVPPGSLKINVTTNNLTVAWNAPFINQTLAYTVSIKLLRSHHYVPNECENGDGSMFNYTTNNTYFLITDYLPDYDYVVNISTTFWDIHTYNREDCFMTTPTAAPDSPANVSVEEYVNAKNEKEYTLHWKMPCYSNGKIQKYHVKITNLNESKVVDDEDVPNSSNETDCKLNLTNLAKQSIFNYELYAVGANNEHGKSFKGTFATASNVIPAPVVTSIDIGSTYFIIEWTMPNISVGNPNVYTFDIEIENRGPRYRLKENCTINPNHHEAIDNKTSYNYTSASPYYLYNVTVTVSSSETNVNSSGYVIVETISSVPDPPDNLTLNVNEHTLFSELNWEMPCNVNGLISNFNVVVSERYSEDSTENRTTYPKKSNESTMNIQLQPSHMYEISVSILLDDGLEGTRAIVNYTTPIGFPGIPILNVSNVSNTSFVIEWLPPIEKTGPIQYYELNITSLGPLYNVPMECRTHDDDVFKIIGVKSPTSYSHSTALAYNRYIVRIRANTLKGYGNFSIAEFDTTEGVPETVRNVGYTINNNLTEEYDATVSITFDRPCHTYGIIKNYSIEYHGMRKSYPDDHGRMVINANDSKFVFKLQPEYNYTYDIWSSNRFLKNVTEGYFNSPAGVPTFNASISIPIDSISTENAKIVLRKDYFSQNNGDVRYIALLLRETMSHPNQNFSKWNSKDWPAPQAGVQQLTDCFWNPFETSSNATFVIGTESYCKPDCRCNNRPLKDDTTYHLTIRVFTSNFYRDGISISFQTDKLSQVAVILGVIFGILFFAIVAIIGLYVWKKQLYRKLSFIYSKKPSDKPPVTNSTAIVPKKFIQYFKNSQSKPEFLKGQFTDLEEKSKEIQAQKSFHFSGLLENKRKNRYVNISPYDDTRVKLLIDEDDEIGSDYINASYVKGYSGGIEYIATQGPLPTTCRDFWKMVIQENVTIIVMVAQFIEKNKQKCYKYFPNNHENLIISDDMEIRCSTELHFGTYLVRNLQVRKDSLQVNVTHMQFLEWPDFNVPTGTEHMLQFIYQIRERLRIEGGIVIVHCSAGVGRTGTLIAADMLLQNVNAGKQIDVFNTVLELRKQRVMMVQTAEQYVYLHRLVADHIDRPPTPDMNEASDPFYENMDMINNQSESQSNSKRKEEESEF